MPTLPTDRRRGSAHSGLIDVARLDPSGRLSTRRLVRALRWRAGQRLDVAASGGVIVVAASATGRHTLTARGEVSLPSQARAMTGIGGAEAVLLAADPDCGLLVVYPVAAVVGLLNDLRTGRAGGCRHGG